MEDAEHPEVIFRVKNQRNTMSEIQVSTRQCSVCKQSSSVWVDSASYSQWRAGKLIQDAFPDMPAPEREVLLTGFHPACWEIEFPREEDEE